MKQLLTLLFAFCALVFRAGAASETPADKVRLAGEVFKIFNAKCADCHGGHLPKPKGKFGYVLDLGRVGKNADYVVPGNAEKSEIYQMVLNNEMPGEDADVPPLTPAELKVVAQWIAVGAPGELPPGVAETAQVALPAPPPPRSFFWRFVAWLGKFHPASTHFPIALLMAGALAEMISWWFRRQDWTLVVQFLVVLGALSAIPTATFGWMADSNKVAEIDVLVYNIHRILGTVTAVCGVVCAILICLPGCTQGTPARMRFRAAIFFSAALVTVTGLLGGMLTFGVDHYKF